MRDVKARGDTLLFHSGHVGFRDRALGAFSDEGLKLRLTLRKALREGMLSGDRHKGHTHHRVGTGRVHSKFLLFPVDFVGEGKVHADTLADPVLLHAAHLFGPAVKLLEIIQKFLGVLGDAQVVTRDFTLFNLCARAPAATVDYLFVGENRLIHRIPVHNLGLAVGNALFEHLEKHPLVPAVVLRTAGRHFARPVKRKPQGPHLFLHVGDVAVGPLRGRDLFAQSGVFCRQPERVPAHGGHHVKALHAAVTVEDVV